MKPRLFLAMLAALALSSSPADAQKLKWTWTADESQIKNGPEPDGSTNSPATGSGYAIYDPSTNMMTVSYTWHNLFADLTKLHIHGPADANQSNPQHVIETFGPPDPPAGLDLRSDTYTETFELATLSQPGGDLSPQDILQIMTDGLAYVNYHSAVFGTGEIRGNLGTPVTIPEPSCTVLGVVLGLGLACRRTARGR